MKRPLYASATLLVMLVLNGCGNSEATAAKEIKPSPEQLVAMKESLGRKLYFDASLSEPAGQSCASCHLPSAGFADPDGELPVSRGVDPAHFGNRNTPTTAYAAFTPEFHFDEQEGLYIGGLFHDGRAATLEAQAKGPFLNPLEMGNADAAMVVAKVAQADYAPLFKQLYGENAFSDSGKAYDQIAEAIATFERSKLFSPFSSKYDAYLEGKVQLSESEKRGLDLFNDEKKGNCAACHPSEKSEDGSHPLFTDYSYDNIGVPKLKESPFYHVDAKFNPEGDKVVDLGLGAIVKNPEENGKFKVPTLRNVALTAPYMHNGAFKTLDEVVKFYNSRDKSSKWGTPEVGENVNKDELGDLKLSAQEEKDIVAFMKTMSDGYQLE
jgi:cytochrome c peroxidase